MKKVSMFLVCVTSFVFGGQAQQKQIPDSVLYFNVNYAIDKISPVVEETQRNLKIAEKKLFFVQRTIDSFNYELHIIKLYISIDSLKNDIFKLQKDSIDFKNAIQYFSLIEPTILQKVDEYNNAYNSAKNTLSELNALLEKKKKLELKQKKPK